LQQLFDDLDIAGSLFTNGRVCKDYARVAEAALKSGWEFVGHSWDQQPTHVEKDQQAMIRRTVRAIKSFTGKAPVGWLSPGLTETLYTPDYLAEAGIKYIADWLVDDEPVTVKTTHGNVLGMPYSLELNDIAMMMVQHHAAAEFESRCTDQFERLYEEGKKRAKIMAIALHPYISGVPHRINTVERVFRKLRKTPGVAFWTGEQIMNWYDKAGKAAPKKSAGRKR